MSVQPGHPPRLSTWDYSTTGAYFVTFTVHGRAPVLSNVLSGALELTAAGRIVEDCWAALPGAFPVVLEEIVIMPDHVHAILGLLYDQNPVKARPSGFRPLMADSSPQLGKVVRAWKARATREIRLRVDPEFRWQGRYFERVVRANELDRIRSYIVSNPGRWRR